MQQSPAGALAPPRRASSAGQSPSSAPAADARRWRVLATESTVRVLDERTILGADSSAQVPELTIDRRSGRAVEVQRNRAEVLDLYKRDASAAGARVVRGHAVLGIVASEQASALIIVTEVEPACNMDGKVIYEIYGVELVQLALPPRAAADAGVSPVISGLVQLLTGKGFYFSQDFDITHTLQWKKRRIAEARKSGTDPVPRLADGSADLFTAADPRFVWNRRLVDQLTRQGVSTRWFVPLMQGHVQMATIQEPHPSDQSWNVALTLMLVSRRGSGRAGMRYYARGLDDNGEVGNFIETEQLARFRLTRSSGEPPGGSAPPSGCPLGWLSFVQIRGSVPVFWEQQPSGPLKLTRDIELTSAAYSRHQDAQELAYRGDIFYANLLSDASASEVLLTEALEKQLGTARTATAGAGSFSHRPYCHFDFHAKVRGQSQAEFDVELEAFLEEIATFLEHSEHLDAVTETPNTGSSEPRRWQRGVLRTNCLDCLDRTNVVQFYVAWAWLRAFCWRYSALHGMLEPRRPIIGDVQPSLQTAVSDSIGALAGFGASLWGSGKNAKRANDDLLSEDRKQWTPVIRQTLQNLWADHGDRISEEYTGTASIMSSVLRQGHHSGFASLEKGWQGLNRAYQASFQDSQRQECIEMLLGAHPKSNDLLSLRSLSASQQAGAVARCPIGSLSVWVGTWNLAGKETAWCTSAAQPGLERWVGDAAPDVAVFSLQEFIDLNAQNIMFAKDGDEARIKRFEAASKGALSGLDSYVKVQSLGMVGIGLTVFVRAALAPFVRDVRIARVRSGAFGATGNKGSVAVRFDLLQTSLCFVAVHFESGQEKAEQRIENLRDSLRCFAGSNPQIPAAPEHDIFVLAGDLNVRLDLPAGSEKGQVQASLRGCWSSSQAPFSDPPWRSLLRYDQFLNGPAAHFRSLGIVEGTITFPPTYKLSIDSDEYNVERGVAWCDRIFYKSIGMRLQTYRAEGALKGSDHRPVCAYFDATILGSAADRATFDSTRRTSPAAVALAQPTMSSSPAPPAQPAPPVPPAPLSDFLEDDVPTLAVAPSPSTADPAAFSVPPGDLLGDEPELPAVSLAPQAPAVLPAQAGNVDLLA